MARKYDCIDALVKAGISYQDAVALRRISMTLHRWHELECGGGNDYGSWSITRGHKIKDKAAPGRYVFNYDDDGDPYMEYHHHQGDTRTTYDRLPDREKGALKRLAKIMANYPGHPYYVQTDPRGCSLYILRPGDLPAEGRLDENYNKGIAVCK